MGGEGVSILTTRLVGGGGGKYSDNSSSGGGGKYSDNSSSGEG